MEITIKKQKDSEGNNHWVLVSPGLPDLGAWDTRDQAETAKAAYLSERTDLLPESPV